jgi:hypothetical protein
MVQDTERVFRFYWDITVSWAFLNKTQFVRFEVFTAVTMKNAIFWDVAPCCYLLTLVPRSQISLPCRKRRYVPPKHRFISQDLHSATSQSAATCSRWFLAFGFLYPEDGGDTLLRNVGSFHRIYTAPHPRRRHSSKLNFFTPTKVAQDMNPRTMKWVSLQQTIHVTQKLEV